jgi:hypothetical protein
MIKFLARLISVVLHPLLMPTFVFLYVATQAPFLLFPFSNRYYFVAFVFFMTYLAPVFVILTLYLTKVIHNINLDNKKDRLWSLAVSLIIYGVALFLMLNKLNVNEKIAMIFTNFIVGLLISTIITFFWKISLHAVSVGGLLFFILFLSFYLENADFLMPFLFLILISGSLMSARLYLGKHTPLQIWLGFSLGVFISSTCLFFI